MKEALRKIKDYIGSRESLIDILVAIAWTATAEAFTADMNWFTAMILAAVSYSVYEYVRHRLDRDDDDPGYGVGV